MTAATDRPYTWDVMDTTGIYVEPVTVIAASKAASAEPAARAVEAKGYEVIDTMDDLVIIAPERR